jgi:photosystem II stability/assembly factor-like uncharacterized protein
MIVRISASVVLLSILTAAGWPIPAGGELGQWVPIGPHSADIRALSQDPGDPQVIFAATRRGGVYLSEDGGVTWVQRSQGLTTDPSTNSYRVIHDVTAHPAAGRVYATGVEIYRSENNGQTWDVFPRPAGSVGNFEVLLLDPDDPDKLTVQNGNGVFVYELVNQIRTWIQPPGITEPPVWILERAPSDPDRFYSVAGYTLTLYRSTNRAASWETVGEIPGSTFRALAVDAADPGRLYLSVDTGCFVSTNGGQSWTRMDDPADDAAIFAFADVAGILMAVGRGAVFSNSSHPDQLAPVADFWHTTATASVILGDGTILLGTRMGVFRVPSSVVNGTGEFLLSTKGMNNAGVSVVVPVPGSDILYAAAGAGFNGGVYRSDDNGQTWKLRATGITNLDVRSLAVSAGNPDVAYAGTLIRGDIGENGKVFRTVDGGLTWTETAELPHSGDRIIITLLAHPTNPDIVYASVQAIDGGIYKSTDGGQTWVRVANGLQSMPLTPGHEGFYKYYAMLSMTADPGNPETLYLGAGGCWGGVYRSRDGGGNWARRSSAYGGASQAMEYDNKPIIFGDPDFWFPVHLELWDIQVDPNDPMHLLTAGTRGDYFTADRAGILFESRNAGDTWSLIRETSRDDYFTESLTGLAIHRYRPGQIYLSNVVGVQVSLDGGDTWNDMNEGLGTQFTRGLEFDPDDPNRLYLATSSRGVWVRELSPVSVRLTHLEIRDTGAGTVELAWGAADAVDHAGFHVDREADGKRIRLTETLLRGSDEYRFVDDAPLPGTVSRYWIVELDRVGRETEHGPLEIIFGAETGGLALGRPRPNPLRTGTRLLLTPSRSREPAAVRVFDTRGRKVVTLLEGAALDAPTWIDWDGRDSRGVRVPGGIYFIQALSGEQDRVRRVLVVP